MNPGDTITYTLRVHNDSDATVAGAVVTDNLSAVLNNATVTVGAGASISGTTLTWNVPTIAAGGADATLTYTATVKAGAYNKTLTNVVTPGPGGDCVSAADCTTDHFTPHYVLSKTSDPATGSTVEPGSEITYTLRVHNDSDASVAGAVVTDDMSDVLNHASVVSVGAGATITGTTLTWNVPTIAAGGADATLSYTVKVDADAIDVTIRNVATPGPGGDCTSEGNCTTDHPVGAWTLKKSSDPAPGSSVDTGSTITYTLTATNTTAVDVTGAMATDTLPTDVTLVTPLPAGLTDNGDGTLTWAIPDLPAGSDPVSVSYKVTVDDTAAGKTLKNVVVPTTPGGECATADGCTTTHKVKQLIVKVADDCKLDAAYLHYTISSKNVPNSAKLPVTATWKLPDGTVVRVDTIPAGQLKGDLLWPGMVLNADGVAIQWPGWRQLEATDFPLPAGADVYGTAIADPSLASFAYRSALTVTFEMNPSETVTVVYPGQTPAGCAVPREPDLQITKTASVSTAAPGQAFDYDINVKNASTLGVAYPVTLSDPIPASLKVTGITIEATGLPHWQNCAISGSDAGGFGGTLNCQLSGALGVSASAPQVTLSVVVASPVSTSSIANTATTCWQNPSLPAEAQKCASDSVVVTVPQAPPLPNTGVPAAQMGWLALLLLFGGGVMLTGERVWRRRTRLH